MKMDLKDLHFTKCGLDGHNLLMEKELDNGRIIAKCKVCGHKLKLDFSKRDNNKNF